jgi:hypothetical protein
MQLQNKATSTARNLVGLPLLLVGVSTLIAQSVGTFTPTGNMTMPRSQHTATLLLDGRVLLAGGVIIDRPTSATEIFHPTANAEIYDPSTGLFTPTGSMTSARSSHIATLLADGRVLIVGGGASGTAELYDPSTGAFTATGNLPPTHGVATATLLNDGRVLVVGYTINSADLYDPSSGTFTQAGPRLAEGPRTPVLQPDGNVLLLPTGDLGGFSVELYNPRTNTFSRSAWPFAAGFEQFEYAFIGYSTGSANLLSNGKVLVTLHSVEGVANYYALLFDSSTGTFAGTGVLNHGRRHQSATSLSDATVLITGGVGDQCGQFPPKAEVYDPVSGKFSLTDSTNPYRNSYTATLLRNGQVLIAGGVGCPKAGSAYSQLASAELYRPVSTPLPPPGLLSLSGDGRGPGAVQHADTFQLVSAGSPAVAGEILTVYCNGLAEGSVIPPQVSIGGRMAEIVWFGNTPGYAGLNQINVRVPSGVAPGPAVPLRLTYIGRPSNEVTISVR